MPEPVGEEVGRGGAPRGEMRSGKGRHRRGGRRLGQRHGRHGVEPEIMKLGPGSIFRKWRNGDLLLVALSAEKKCYFRVLFPGSEKRFTVIMIRDV